MSIAEKLQTIAENESKVFEAGKKAQYDAFWDGLQHNGDGTADYRYMFYYWEDNYYNPKYPIFSTKASMVATFQNAQITNTLVDIDLSQTQQAGSMFNFCSRLHTIPKIIFGENLTNINNMFSNCAGLVNLTADGVIALNGLNLQWSTNLTIESLRSIINALADKSADTSGTVWTVTVGSTNLEKLTADDLNEIEAKGWIFV